MPDLDPNVTALDRYAHDLATVVSAARTIAGTDLIALLQEARAAQRRIAELEAERERLFGTQYEMADWVQRSRDLEAANERLREWLQRHARHGLHCRLDERTACTCGLDTLRAQGQP